MTNITFGSEVSRNLVSVDPISYIAKTLQNIPGTAHELINTLAGLLFKNEPGLQSLNVILLEQEVSEGLRYVIGAELRGSDVYSMAPGLYQRESVVSDT